MLLALLPPSACAGTMRSQATTSTVLAGTQVLAISLRLYGKAQLLSVALLPLAAMDSGDRASPGLKGHMLCVVTHQQAMLLANSRPMSSRAAAHHPPILHPTQPLHLSPLLHPHQLQHPHPHLSLPLLSHLLPCQQATSIRALAACIPATHDSGCACRAMGGLCCMMQVRPGTQARC